MADSTSTILFKTLSSGLVGVCGVSANLLSLFYFIRVEEHRGVANKLFILLNSLDLLVSLTAPGVVIVYQLPVHGAGVDSLMHGLKLLFKIGVQSTAYTTCLISVTRTICLARPFYRVKVRVLVVCTVVFVVCVPVCCEVLVLYLLYTRSGYRARVEGVIQYMTLSILAAVFIVVVSSNIVSVYQLRRSKDVDGPNKEITALNHRATITVLILSILFCLLNITFMIVLGCNVSNTCLPSSLLGWFSFWIAIPLNSCLNPCVYFARKQDMRDYVREVWRRCRGKKVEEGFSFRRGTYKGSTFRKVNEKTPLDRVFTTKCSEV